MTRFTAISALRLWSGTEPAVLARYRGVAKGGQAGHVPRAQNEKGRQKADCKSNFRGLFKNYFPFLSSVLLKDRAGGDTAQPQNWVKGYFL